MTDRNSIETLVKRVLGKVEVDVVVAIERGVGKGYDKSKMKDRLWDYVGDRSKLSKLTDKLFDQLKSQPVSSKKRPKFEEFPTSATNGDAKRRRRDDTHGPERAADGTVAEKLRVKEVMANAQKMIEERKKKLNLPSTPFSHLVSNQLSSTNTKLAPAEAEQFMQQALDKAKRAAELKARIAAKLPVALAGIEPTGTLEIKSETGGPAPLILDSTGKAVDASGNILSLAQRTPTLKANIRAEKKQQFVKPPQEETEQGDSFQDWRVNLKGAQRVSRHFAFHDKGEFELLANKQRAKAKLEKLQSEISQASKKTGISSAVKLAMVAPKQAELAEAEVPSQEWWDSIVLGDKPNYEEALDDQGRPTIDFSRSAWINNLVEHPIQLRPPDEPVQAQYVKVQLTTAERKKLRRQNRKEILREKTEKIRLGLEPAPEPKMKISNLMRVLGTDAIQDPTKMEAHVRDQVAKRLKKHEEANAARKLTPEQRAAKKARKLQDDTSLGVQVSVYRVNDMSHPSRKFKVEVNAKQLGMTGIVVLHKDVNVVVVEGGFKQQKFYKRLMLHRMKWDEEKKSSRREEEPNATPNKCVLIWEGLVKKRSFGEIRFKACPLEKQARELFEKHGVPHYWDLSFAGSILDQEQDTI